MNTYNIEVTDTFGGEANYAWVRRFTFKAKSELGAIQKLVREYASVLTPAGWRGVVFSALVERISSKRVRVVKVVAIDGDPVARVMTRTGSNRQKFDGVYFAGREAGKMINLPTRRYAIFNSLLHGNYTIVVRGADIATAERWGGFVAWLGAVKPAEIRVSK